MALSPDGLHLAAEADDGSATIDVISTLDGSMQPLAGGVIDTGGLRWSPDGQLLAYVSSGILYLADADGASSRPIAVSFPGPPAGSSLGGPDQIAWAPDLAHVAFTSPGMAVLADVQAAQGQVVSTKLVTGVAFSPSGDKLAVGQQFVDTSSYPEATTLIVDSASLTSQEIGSSPGIPAWSAAGDWLVQGSSLLPLATGQPVALDGAPVLSPDRTELALVGRDGGLHVRSFDGSEDRVLASGLTAVGYLTWTPDGSALWFADGVGLHVLRASDGSALLLGTGGTWGPGYGLMFGPHDWFALEAKDSSGFLTQRLDLGPDSGATFSTDRVIVDGFTARWLDDDKIAFVRGNVLQIAAADGSGTHGACDASSVIKPQTGPQ